ncbi:MAG: DNA-3-methyladenine glycosylase family protein [Oscillospiraceae bacterium]
MNYILKTDSLDIRQTLLCGQCFRWKELDDGSFEGIVRGRRAVIAQLSNGAELRGINESDIPMWEEYFDLATDYNEIKRRLSADDTLRKACECSPGIRLLRQEPFETLISFIISQNNNIPRISGIISRLCESFGEKIEGGYSFPTLNRLEGITPDDLAPLRAGFRAKYICDAVNRLSRGEISFERIDELPLEPARNELKKILGVGDKVADCVLLFAFHKTDAFPRDVWVKRLMAQFYPEGLPECAKGIEGAAQQYLFDYVRNNNGLMVNV